MNRIIERSRNVGRTLALAMAMAIVAAPALAAPKIPTPKDLNQLADSAITADHTASQASGVTDLTLTLKNYAGRPVTGPRTYTLYVTNSATGATHTAVTSLAAITNGTLTTLATGKVAVVTTSSAGKLDVRLTGSAGTYYVALVAPSGKLLVSKSFTIQ